MKQINQTTLFQDLAEQDGGVVKSIYDTGTTIATLAIQDASASEEMKNQVDNLRKFLDILFQIHESMHPAGEQAPPFKLEE